VITHFCFLAIILWENIKSTGSLDTITDQHISDSGAFMFQTNAGQFTIWHETKPLIVKTVKQVHFSMENFLWYNWTTEKPFHSMQLTSTSTKQVLVWYINIIVISVCEEWLTFAKNSNKETNKTHEESQSNCTQTWNCASKDSWSKNLYICKWIHS
jgi:hypothetical protein